MFDHRKVSGKLAIISVLHFQLHCILGVRSWSCLTEENKKPSQLLGLRFGFVLISAVEIKDEISQEKASAFMERCCQEM